MVDRNQAIALYQSGKPLHEIGDLFGVSRQRINQILRDCDVDKRTRFTKGTHFNQSEKIISVRMAENGIENKIMPYAADYDIETINGKKIEVKYRSVPKKEMTKFGLYSTYQIKFYNKRFDYAIVMIGDIEDPKIYVFDKSEIGKSLTISEKQKYKSKRLVKAKNAWSKIL